MVKKKEISMKKTDSEAENVTTKTEPKAGSGARIIYFQRQIANYEQEQQDKEKEILIAAAKRLGW